MEPRQNKRVRRENIPSRQHLPDFNDGCYSSPPPDAPDEDLFNLRENVFADVFTNLEAEDMVFFDIPYDEQAPLNSDQEPSDSESDMETESDDNHDRTAEPDNAPPNVNWGSTEADIIIRTFCYFILMWQVKRNISDEAVNDLLMFLFTVFRYLGHISATCEYIASKIPKALAHIKKNYGVQGDFKRYVVCPKCKSLYDTKDCSEIIEGIESTKHCNFIAFPNNPSPSACDEPLMKVIKKNGKQWLRPFKVYYYQPLESILSRFLERPGFAEKCELWRVRNQKEGLLTDVYDGRIWQEFADPAGHNFLNHQRNYGVMLNVDWFQPFKYVNMSVGAMYLIILNLPIEERFKLENVILVGLIPCFPNEPSTNTFLLPLVKDLRHAWHYGFALFCHSSKTIRQVFKCALLCCGCDIPAARKVCGFPGHMAILGCHKCLKSFFGRDFSGFDRENWIPRDNNDHRMKADWVKESRTQTEQALMVKNYGVRYSVLLLLEYFDPVRMTIVDPMHNLLMGSGKKELKTWTEDNLLKNKFKVIQELVDRYECPADMGGIPRKIASHFSGMTADQLKNWILLFSMFALKDVFKEGSGHLKCWQKLVLACRCLCTRVIDMPSLDRGDALLMSFCKSFQQLYGAKRVTPNMHMHGHLRECILDFGPIYGFWLFSFERFNGILGRFHTNNRNIEIQLFNRFTTAVNVRGLQVNDAIPDDIASILDRLAGNTVRGSLLSQSKSLTNLQFVCLSRSNCVIQDHQWDLPLSYTDPLCREQDGRGLSQFEEKHLTDMYRHIYGDVVDRNMVLYTSCFEINSVKFMGHVLGAATGRSSRSSLISANWSDNNGKISESSKPRAGEVQLYIVHAIKIGDMSKVHVLAQVFWYRDFHSGLELKVKPVEIWSPMTVTPGPSLFVPIQRIRAKCVAATDIVRGRKALFVSPRQRYLIYD